MFKHLSAWSDYYNPNITIDEHYENHKSSLQSDGYVSNCCFSGLTAQNGAAILSLSNNRLLVEQCTINNCTVTQNTAGILVSAGNCIIAYVTSQYGYAMNNDGFCSINTDSNRTINSVFDSSISLCEAVRENTMAHSYGYINIKSVNLSNNKASSASALNSVPNLNNEKTNYATDVSYCSFSNNTATKQHCIYLSFYGSSNKHYIQNCNIIENNANKTLFSLGETTLYHCSILNNGNPCFYTADENSTILLKICYRDDFSSTDFISVSETEQQQQFIHSLPFYATNKCAISFSHCTENSFLQNLYIRKIIIPSPFLFLLFSNGK